MIKLKKLMGEGTKPPSPMHNEARRHFLEVISTYKAFGRKLQAEHDLAEIANTLGGIVDAATTLLLYKIQPDYWPALKSFLIYLNSITDNELTEIEHDMIVLETLGKI